MSAFVKKLICADTTPCGMRYQLFDGVWNPASDGVPHGHIVARVWDSEGHEHEVDFSWSGGPSLDVRTKERAMAKAIAFVMHSASELG
jgi:hypothetical protein